MSDPAVAMFGAALMVVAGVAIMIVLYRNRQARGDRLYKVAMGLAVAVILCGFVALYLGAQVGGGVQPHAVAGPDDLLEMDLLQKADDFEYVVLDTGETARLFDDLGKVVIVNVWATWCAPCLAEIPDLNRLQERYGPEGLVVISISDEMPDELIEFEKSIDLTTVAAYTEELDSMPVSVRKAFEIRPTTYIVDRDGNYRRYILGARNYAYFERAIEPYL